MEDVMHENPAPSDRSQKELKSHSRLYFIDHVRIFLVILVVLHHVAIVYGAVIPFYYVEPPKSGTLTFLVLLVFVLVNQSWFMGALFFLAGFCTPGSYERKGAGTYIVSRILRLGIPLLVYMFILSPVSHIGLYLMPEELTGITSALSWQTFPYLSYVDMGPLWFVVLLIMFSLAYAAVSVTIRNRTTTSIKKNGMLTYGRIGMFIIALTAAGYLIRLAIPIGKTVIGFPTLSYLPQYIGFFILGTVFYRRNLFQSLPKSIGVVGVITALSAWVLLFPLAFSGKLFSLRLTPALVNSMGHGHWRSAVYALYDSIFAAGMLMGIITLFRRIFNRQGIIGRFLSQQSYLVYITHIPVIVFLAFALRNIEMHNLLKFVLASAVMVPACFALSGLIRKIPGVSRIV